MIVSYRYAVVAADVHKYFLSHCFESPPLISSTLAQDFQELSFNILIGARLGFPWWTCQVHVHLLCQFGEIYLVKWAKFPYRSLCARLAPDGKLCPSYFWGAEPHAERPMLSQACREGELLG